MDKPLDQGDITQLLIAHRDGDPDAFEKLVPLVYDDLRRIAHHQLSRLRPGKTLNTTALVHEAYLHMVDQNQVVVSDRRHFFGVAPRAGTAVEKPGPKDRGHET